MSSLYTRVVAVNLDPSVGYNQEIMSALNLCTQVTNQHGVVLQRIERDKILETLPHTSAVPVQFASEFMLA